MKITKEMTEVSICEATSCSYNIGKRCHALAITVGGINDHQCDTICRASFRTHEIGLAGVGACKAASCIHNMGLECRADAIRVGIKMEQPECLSFSEK